MSASIPITAAVLLALALAVPTLVVSKIEDAGAGANTNPHGGTAASTNPKHSPATTATGNGHQQQQQTQKQQQLNTCVDYEGHSRKDGEEWTIRKHFVAVCHDVSTPGSGKRAMREEVIACLREDGSSRIAVGAEVDEPNGMTIVCKKGGANGEVRREWHWKTGKGPAANQTAVGSAVQGANATTVAFSTTGANSSSSSSTSGAAGGVNCFDKSTGAVFQHKSFELTCPTKETLPKLVACFPPELKGEKVGAGETKRVGETAAEAYEVTCEQAKDGSFTWRYNYHPNSSAKQQQSIGSGSNSTSSAASSNSVAEAGKRKKM